MATNRLPRRLYINDNYSQLKARSGEPERHGWYQAEVAERCTIETFDSDRAIGFERATLKF
jgi:hypothetical protein